MLRMVFLKRIKRYRIKRKRSAKFHASLFFLKRRLLEAKSFLLKRIKNEIVFIKTIQKRNRFY